MIKKLLASALLLVVFSSAAQEHNCATNHVHREKLATDEDYAQKMINFDAKYKQISQSRNLKNSNTAPVYVIPVVVHIMHRGEPVGQGTNLSDEVIRNKIKAINEDFRNQAPQQPYGADTQIEFALAVRDPQGQCTTGITRTNMSNNAEYMEYGVKRYGDNGLTDTQIKALDYWNSSQYYNIWLVSEIDNVEINGVAGYAYFAGAHGETYDGAVIRSNVFAVANNMTATHELGHGLNLYHTFEGDEDGTACPIDNGCGDEIGDCVQDTASHKRGESCITTTSNGCYPENTNLDYLFNFMNSGCSPAFTTGQKIRMADAIVSLRASYLRENGNMSLVPASIPQPEFTVTPSIACGTGSTVHLRDISECIPHTYLDEPEWEGVSFNWMITNGTNTYSFNTQTVDFTPVVAGSYDVSLSISNENTNMVTTSTGAIVVSSGTTAEACIPVTGNTGNFLYTISDVSFKDIHNVTSETLNGNYQDFVCTHNTIVNAGQTYPFSLRVRAGSQYPEHYRVYIDFNNNGTFESEEMVVSGTNPSGTVNTIITDVEIPTTAVQGTLLRMRVIGEAYALTEAEIACSAAFFTCDIEDYGIMINSALGNEEFSLNRLAVYPNPTTSIVTISCQDVLEKVEIYNMLGQLVLKREVNTEEAIIDIASLTSGTYLVVASSGGSLLKSKIIKN